MWDVSTLNNSQKQTNTCYENIRQKIIPALNEKCGINHPED